MTMRWHTLCYCRPPPGALGFTLECLCANGTETYGPAWGRRRHYTTERINGNIGPVAAVSPPPPRHRALRVASSITAVTITACSRAAAVHRGLPAPETLAKASARQIGEPGQGIDIVQLDQWGDDRPVQDPRYHASDLNVVELAPDMRPAEGQLRVALFSAVPTRRFKHFLTWDFHRNQLTQPLPRPHELPCASHALRSRDRHSRRTHRVRCGCRISHPPVSRAPLRRFVDFRRNTITEVHRQVPSLSTTWRRRR